ncbi:Bax inhibitor-1/YccA family protein [Vibrio cholerae]|jgi:modulator of FtsH protease|uniref:Bax inhibitor-1/YccA family protein n=1 Tax=Vibrio cholerae TaxID=666 RepID=A0A5C9SWP9_VIBCL|nr:MULTISPECIES: Bax inhibitor-1/YccA family protein [Vibrio]EGR5061865.1 Bax inhibitor-1/YccA family protein [Vibrio cholerae]ELJ8546719.1 Bax inhibitor-1/YccA family protein [Vibrio cholerae]ELY5186229.1 Bax inhibitor-1/YccA family protein [Vibrio cholerae]ELY5286064.1 Bax inhibitor-1/YccA family protein [Vibrio cholerae]KFD82293.1 inhibitor of apoptosis-promoting Bax1 family protein [Vibrio paracholerae]
MNTPMFTRTSSMERTLETNKVLKNTYFLLSMTLVTSAIAAMATMAIGISPIVALVMQLAAIGILFFVMPKAMNSSSGLVWTFVFTGLMGGALGPMLNFYAAMPNGPIVIAQALGLTGMVFLGLSAYTITSKKDFSFMRNFLFAGLIIVIVAALINIFVGSTVAHLAISSVSALVFSGFILFDTSRIVRGEETNYISATISMYLNILNLFTSLLSILGIMNNND